LDDGFCFAGEVLAVEEAGEGKRAEAEGGSFEELAASEWERHGGRISEMLGADNRLAEEEHGEEDHGVETEEEDDGGGENPEREGAEQGEWVLGFGTGHLTKKGAGGRRIRSEASGVI